MLSIESTQCPFARLNEASHQRDAIMPKGIYERRGHPRLRLAGRLNGIGERVAQRAAELKLSQAAACARVSVETADEWRPLRSEWARICQGTRTVTDIELRILSRVLEVDACWLLGTSKADAEISS